MSKIKFFAGQKSILRHHYIQNVKDGIQIRVYKINNKRVIHFSRFISVKVKKISDSISGKVKKIEAQARWWFSYKKKRVINQCFQSADHFCFSPLVSIFHAYFRK